MIPVAAAKEPSPRRELVCAECGYGIFVRQPPERCPMCGGTRWKTPRGIEERSPPDKLLRGHT